MPNTPKKPNKPSSQKFLPIQEIKEGVVVLKDGTLRSVLMVSSINFSLKSEDEQNAIISSYVGFLNSLEHPLQIAVQSRQLQIKPYLEDLAKKEREQANELLRAQIADYRVFVEELVDMGKIMTKRFYIIVYYNPLSNRKRGFWQRTSDVISPTKQISLSQKEFARRHKDLFIQVDKIVSGLSGMGLRASILNTQSLIELYYNTYNPVVAESQKMVDVSQLQIEA